MKIAIVAPSPVPFAVGGAENLFWGLQEYINRATSHRCELIKLPSRERSFKDLMYTYLAFARLDLSHFDVVISTKYPSWMVRHPHHVVYMVHPLRGLYDTYHLLGLPDTCRWDGDTFVEVRRLMDAIKRNPDSNEGIVSLLQYLAGLNASDLPPGTLDFPGPFVRDVVHFLDSIALSRCRVTRYVAISKTIRARAGYFPDGAAVTVAYPPPRVSSFECGRQEYFFTASRLDGPKRIELLVHAMRMTKCAAPLYIAGTGPEEERIREAAGFDERIRFLGFVPDADLRRWYKDAIAVPFIPYDEDYGFITIEAMLSGKPVLTLEDSGGPNEFVVNDQTGLSVAPTIDAIADGLDRLNTRREAAAAMGRSARQLVSQITWANVVDSLLGPSAHKPCPQSNRGRRRMTVALTFPVYPPRGGGQVRVFHLYKELARHVDVELITSCGPTEPALRQEIAEGMTEIRIPRTERHQDAENAYSSRVNWTPVTDIVMPKLYTLTPNFVAALRESAKESDVVVASHPYLGTALHQLVPQKPMWIESHNVEYILKQGVLPASAGRQALLDIVRAEEGYCWRNSKLAFACAGHDLQKMEELYGPTSAAKLEVPNGVALQDVPFVGPTARGETHQALGFGRQKVVLFMGSWHGPNLDAVREVLGCAGSMPDVVFLVVGSVCAAFETANVPSNVKLLGVVDDAEKRVLLSGVDLCLNPMEGGSGSNLKMLDYFASGCPVVSTVFGARGIAVNPSVHYLPMDSQDLIGGMRNALTVAPTKLDAMVRSARAVVETQYSWSIIAEKFAESAEFRRTLCV